MTLSALVLAATLLAQWEEGTATYAFEGRLASIGILTLRFCRYDPPFPLLKQTARDNAGLSNSEIAKRLCSRRKHRAIGEHP